MKKRVEQKIKKKQNMSSKKNSSKINITGKNQKVLDLLHTQKKKKPITSSTISNSQNKSKFKNNINTEYIQDKTIEDVALEMKNGFAILKKIKQPLATFYGSHKVYAKDYKLCQQIVTLLKQENFGVVSGGGTGIMEAANSQAVKENMLSIGFRGAAFKEEHVDAKIYTYEISFKYVFVRRFMLCIRSNVLFFFPGGYGTLNELMEILVLMQSHIIERVPIILVNKKFWKGLDEWFDYLATDKKIKEEDLELLHYVDSVKEVEKILFKK
jgi:uncharacterized protein (TIGR00730 family)